jgi:hypothetical protein
MTQDFYCVNEKTLNLPGPILDTDSHYNLFPRSREVPVGGFDVLFRRRGGRVTGQIRWKFPDNAQSNQMCPTMFALIAVWFRNYPSGIFGPVSKDLAWIASVIALTSGRGARSRVTGLRAARDFAVCMRDLADI